MLKNPLGELNILHLPSSILTVNILNIVNALFEVQGTILRSYRQPNPIDSSAAFVTNSKKT
jgi:hypothetical protein